MALESATYISDLVATNPVSGDNVGAGDDHVRLLKSTIKASFPNVTGAVTPTHTELNFVDGVTSAIQTQLDAKVALTAAGRWAQIGTTQSPSAVATLDLINGSGGFVIDSTYDMYLLELIALKPATDTANLWIRTTTDASSFGTSGYEYAYEYIQAGSSAVTVTSSASALAIIVASNVGNASGEAGVYAQIHIYQPSAASRCFFQWQASYAEATSSAGTNSVGMGTQNLTSNVDGIRIMFSTGNITSGTVRLFGRIK